MSDRHLTDMVFSGLKLPPAILQGIEDAGFSYCTPIQAETLPLALAGKDVAGQAQTGTGKTAAFLIATMFRLLNSPTAEHKGSKQPRAIILAPTRELAVQIYNDALILGRHTGLEFTVVYGGMGYETQRKTLEEGVDVLIGTPGRFIDYYRQGVFHLNNVEVVVIDEADRMFDLGFIRDIRYVLRRMPKPEKRLSMLFSATLSLRVTELAYEHMNNSQLVEVEPEQVTAAKVKQNIYYTANDEKIPLLIGLLKHMDPRRSMVFVNTKRNAETVWGYLEGNGIKAALLTGDVPQNKRLKLLHEFQAGVLPVLVATDVAARGLHISDVSHVFNFDLPQDSEDYVHRIGRTARLGASGDAISFACEDHSFSLLDIEEFIGHKIQVQPVRPEMLATLQPPVRLQRRKPRPGQRTQGRNPPRKDKGTPARGRRRAAGGR